VTRIGGVEHRGRDAGPLADGGGTGEPWRSSEHLCQAAKYGLAVRIVPASRPGADLCVRNRIRAQRGSRGAKMTQKCAVAAGLLRKDGEAEEVRLPAIEPIRKSCSDFVPRSGRVR
jgi:hypothetical protein